MELLKFETFTKLHYRNAVGNVLVQAHPQQCLSVPSPHLPGWPSPATRVGRITELKCPQSYLVQLSDQGKSPFGNVPDSCSPSLCLHTPSERELTT